MTLDTALPAPGTGLDPATMPAHWLLARLGKRVMRPGGGVVSDAMLAGLAIGPGDDVVDLAPALGTTVRRVQELGPATFRGVERGETEAERARRQVSGMPYTCVVASPADTGLPDGSATVVYGEACLSLETDAVKRGIIAEAARLLRPGGRLGLHELLLRPDDLPAAEKRRIGIAISRSVRVGARPLTQREWIRLLEEGGFAVRTIHRAPMLLLSPATMVKDEGVRGTAVLVGRIARDGVALRRVADLWRTMHAERHHLGSISLVAVRDG
jgi:SAM-dependent methyltransferase